MLTRLQGSVLIWWALLPFLVLDGSERALALMLVSCPEHLHFGLTLQSKSTFIFATDPNDSGTIDSLAGLFSSPYKHSFRYKKMLGRALRNPENHQFIEALVSNTIQNPWMQEIFYPLEVVEDHEVLRNALRRYGFLNYRPGIIKMSQKSLEVFQPEELKHLALLMVHRPHLVGSLVAARCAWNILPDDAWELDEASSPLTVSKKILEQRDHDLIAISCLSRLQERMDSLKPSPLLKEQIQLLRTEHGWLAAYEWILEHIKARATKLHIPVWHGRLLTQTLQFQTWDKSKMVELIANYLILYDLEQIPYLTLLTIAEQIKLDPAYLISHKSTGLLLARLTEIDNRFPELPPFWGGINEFMWKFKLSLRGGRQLDLPANPCDLDCAVKSLTAQRIGRKTPVLFSKNEFERPVTVGELSGSTRKVCTTLECFFKQITLLALRRTDLLITNRKGLVKISADAANRRDPFWGFLAQLITYNLIYFNRPRILFKKQFWFNILYRRPKLTSDRTVEPPPNERAIATIAGQLNALDIAEFFPSRVFLREED